MSERRWFNVFLRCLGIWYLISSLGWAFSPVERYLEVAPTSRAYTMYTATWQAEAVSAGWRIVVGLLLVRGSGRVVQWVYPTGFGACQTCGYDIRATPDRCPECGATPADSRAASPTSNPATPDVEGT